MFVCLFHSTTVIYLIDLLWFSSLPGCGQTRLLGQESSHLTTWIRQICTPQGCLVRVQPRLCSTDKWNIWLRLCHCKYKHGLTRSVSWLFQVPPLIQHHSQTSGSALKIPLYFSCSSCGMRSEQGLLQNSSQCGRGGWLSLLDSLFPLKKLKNSPHATVLFWDKDNAVHVYLLLLVF